MILRIPSYYKEFSCIADRCQNSCCLGWEIDIDEETWEYYQAMEGPFGERLRSHMTKGEDNSFRLTKDNRCPFLNEKNLCDIVIEKGETSLCAICTEYPRQTLEYGDIRERCLSISCEEVGRILFEKKEPVTFEEQVMEDLYQPWEAGEFYEEEEDSPEAEDEEDSDIEWLEDSGAADPGEMLRGEHLQRARDYAIAILQDRTHPIEERITEYLRFCAAIQNCLNEEDWEAMDRLSAEKSATEEKGSYHFIDGYAARLRNLDGMEILDEEWRDCFARMKEAEEKYTVEERAKILRDFMAFYRDREHEYEQLMVYFTFRYALKSIYDYQFLAKAQLAVLSFLTIRDMDALYYHDHASFTLQNRIDLARVYSREVEHSEDNLEYLADAFMFEPELSPEALAAQINFGIKGGKTAENIVD